MQQRAKLLQNSLFNLQNEEFSKVERLILSKRDFNLLKEDIKFQNIIKSVAHSIQYLRFKSLESLNSFAQKGQFDLNDFQNLKKLSISSDFSGIPSEAEDKFFDLVFQELNKPKKLSKLYIDLESNELKINQIDQLSKNIAQMKNLDSFRLELGHNNIQDEGCYKITQAISKLTQLKELILGLENNQLGNDGFKQIFEMISQLQNLESLQIDFWGNGSNDDAYEDIYDILKNSKVCQSLKEVRMFADTPMRIQKNPIKLIQSFSLFTNLTNLSFTVDQYRFTEDIAEGLNTILLNNSKTLKTVIIDFLKYQDYIIEQSNNIKSTFKDMNQMIKLENIFIQFHSKQSYSSACDFFEEMKKCPNLLRLAIPTQFSELLSCSLSQTITYFKRVLDIQYLLQFEYAKYTSELDFLWYDQFFQKEWSYRHFIDPFLVNQVCNTLDDFKQKQDFHEYIQELSEQYVGDGGSYESNNESVEANEENLDSQNKDMDNEFQHDTNLTNHKLISYLIVQRHYNFKMTELIRLTVYNKMSKDIILSQIQCQSIHLQMNFLDLHIQ
ncbi:hypothetical protein TTHERM_00160610 (macronuclear) [Tetrahymena thermophila SB210]|uniref:Kinase domain protein n=1 Tax=Tetrahymena thermophila (strain SB210) TaxID=312017 RepID=Q22W71_TETTS|nr:hypothetical protein TTHERM_00160610 [Tetrahymena thermophila SB210]EAR89546.2 hypothetical protein TTHERM_00160610 [Tetrahymena thermophila SB210]|eukprot:XP_001009791.2 hypothetical protein TTHERM_00160610 [Tetrahymena thermophila SB210]